MSIRSVAVIGAGLAGVSAAETLRHEGFDGTVTLIGAEPHLPYDRPPLSKEFMRGEKPFEKIVLRSAAQLAEAGIEVRLGRPVVELDLDGGSLLLAGGERVAADRVVLATGARNRRLPIPGLELDGVHALRTVDDAERIRAAARPGARAVLVGMGFVGCELAAALTHLGCQVTGVEMELQPLQRALGPEVGEVIAQLHRERGVELRLGQSVAAIEGDRGRAIAVTTRSGLRLECDFVVAGLGVEPGVELAEAAGLAIEDGVLTDEYCRTSDDRVFAAGDVARHYHPVHGEHLRVEHWQNALRQGAAAARNLLGAGVPYSDVHWFWSDQYDVNIQFAGHRDRWDRLVVRGNPALRDFVGFYVRAGVVHAAVAVNRPRDLRRAIPLIASMTPVTPEELADERVDLRDLAARG